MWMEERWCITFVWTCAPCPFHPPREFNSQCSLPWRCCLIASWYFNLFCIITGEAPQENTFALRVLKWVSLDFLILKHFDVVSYWEHGHVDTMLKPQMCNLCPLLISINAVNTNFSLKSLCLQGKNEARLLLLIACCEGSKCKRSKSITEKDSISYFLTTDGSKKLSI